MRAGGIVFIHPSDELYGADRMLLQILAAVPHDVPVEVWLPQDLDHASAPLCEELERRGVVVRHLDLPILRRAYRTPRGMIGLLHRGFRLARELRRARPRTVYCTTSAAFLAAPIARTLGVRDVIGHVQEIWARSDRIALTPAALSTHRLLAISTPVREALPSRVRRRTEVVVNCTIDPGEPPGAAHEGPLRFVVASRWSSGKGHRTLLEAWDTLERPALLTVLGGLPPTGGVDVPGLVATLRHPERVNVVGDVADVGPFIAAADVVLMPSEAPEGFGLVIIEAFARSRAVVATDAGGPADIVEEGVTGWLYPPRDAPALARILRSLERVQVEAAGSRARACFEREYNAEAYAVRWRSALGLPAIFPQGTPAHGPE